MFRRILFTAIALYFLCALPAHSQTVDELIQKNLNAHGGLDKLKAIQSLRMTGKMTLPQGMEAPFIYEKKRPEMLRIEFNMSGAVGVQAYDGETAWQLMPMMGLTDPQKLPDDETEDMVEQADFDGPLVDSKEKGVAIEYAGKEDVQGTETDKLKITLKNGKVRYLYLDGETGLEIKASAIEQKEGVERTIDTYFGDFKEVNGVIFPFFLENKVRDQQGPQYTIEKIEMDVDIDNSKFKMPESKPAES